jgi:hypothetical protein
MQAIKRGYEKGLNTLIKPKRGEYDETIIGARIFPAGPSYVVRMDFSVKNEEGYIRLT